MEPDERSSDIHDQPKNSRNRRHKRFHPPLRLRSRYQDAVCLHQDHAEQHRRDEDPELQVAQDALDVDNERSHGLRMAKTESTRGGP
jgi:hypothetical protein